MAGSGEKQVVGGDPVSRRTHAERRDQAETRILATAARLVADRGLDHLTLARVGKDAGYSRALPRHYFGKRDDLVGALARFIVDRFANSLAQKPPREPGLESLIFAVDSYFETAISRPRGARALLMVALEALCEPAIAPAIAALNDRSIRRLADHIQIGISAGHIRPDIDARARAVLILGSMRMSVMQWMADPQNIDIDKVRSAFIDQLRRSLAAAGGKRAAGKS